MSVHNSLADGLRRSHRRRRLAVALGCATALGTLSAGVVATTAVSAPTTSCSVKPDASNTGATGTRTASDVATLKDNGTLVNKNLSDELRVVGDGVVVRNVSVKGPIVVTGDNVTLEHVTATSVVSSGGSRLKVTDSNLSGGGTAIHLTSDRGTDHRVRSVELTGNYIHDPASEEKGAYSGTHVRGADGVKISCSNYDLGGYGNAAVFLEDANGGTSNVSIKNNWLNGGGFTIYGASDGLVVAGNVFGNAALYGRCEIGGQAVTQSSNLLSDGSKVEPCGADTQPRADAPVEVKPVPTPPVTAVKPTTAPAPAPAAGPAAAAGGTSKCAFKPSAATTGASGPRARSSVTVLKDGDTLADADVSSLEIVGSNVTVRNVSVNGSVLITGDNARLDHISAQSVSVSSASGATVQYAEISSSREDAIHITSDRGRLVRNVVLRYNYIHDPQAPAGAHFDGTQVRGVDGLLIECSVYDPGPYESTFNAAIYLEGDNGGNSNVRVRSNWLYGFAFPLMAGPGPGTSFTDNRLGGDIKWGPCYFGAGVNSGNFTSSGNVWDATNAKVDICGLG